jgi:hypothetical protein
MLEKSKCVIAVAALLVGTQVVADNRAEFEQWMKQETQNYQEYRDKRDKEFTSFLKMHWKEMKTFQGVKRDPTPKPVDIPVAPPRPEPRPEPLPLTPVPEPETPIKQPSVETPPVKPEPRVVKVPPIEPVPDKPVVKPMPAAPAPSGKTIGIKFFGQSLKFSYDPKLKVNLNSRIDEKAMSDYWSSVSRANFEPLLKQIEAQREPLQLNDWAYAMLVHEVASQIYPHQNNERAMLSWFIMTKAGYNARIAYDSRRVYLLLPSQQQLFAAPYFTFDNVRYYALGFDGKKQQLGRVFTYDGQYPGASKRLDMRLTHALNTLRTENNRVLKFSYNGKTYSVRVAYDKETVRFFETYPQMDIRLYFAADVNRATGNPILQQLKKIVEGHSEKDAVNILLRFVQTAFKYKTDEGQFGTENYLFPEETLYYPYSDCEDRSVFFAWLVRNLLGLEVVGLDYPGHIATAVKFRENVVGDAIRYNNQRYVIADPTYINARAGMTMPQYKNKSPGVINFKI